MQLIHLSSALLTVLLWPTLLRSAEATGSKAILVNVSSNGVSTAVPFLKAPEAIAKKKSAAKAEKGTSATETPFLRYVNKPRKSQQNLQYGKTKLIHLYFIRELNRHLEAYGDKVEVRSLDPGVTMSEISTVNMSARILGKLLVYRSLEPCARTVVNSCVVRDGENLHGVLLRDYDVVP